MHNVLMNRPNVKQHRPLQALYICSPAVSSLTSYLCVCMSGQADNGILWQVPAVEDESHSSKSFLLTKRAVAALKPSCKAIDKPHGTSFTSCPCPSPLPLWPSRISGLHQLCCQLCQMFPLSPVTCTPQHIRLPQMGVKPSMVVHVFMHET